MFTDLTDAWKQVYATYLEGKIHKVMYYYLTTCIIVVGGLYIYLYYMGCVGFAVLFSALSGVQVAGVQPPITIVQAIGMILIVRYTLLGGIDAVAKRTPEKLDERLVLIEDKVRDMHKLAFEGFLESEKVKKLRKEIKK